jgi:general secretion pathway protein K
MARRERGFALLVVLWSLVLLGLLLTQVMSSGRTALALATNLRAASEERAAADGAIQEATFHVLADGVQYWAPNSVPHRIIVGGFPVDVRIGTLDGKINPNLVSAPLLAGLMQAVGASPDQADSLANAIVAWRTPPSSANTKAALLAAYHQAGLVYGPPGRPFADLGELGAVIGMTPDLLAKLTPHLSLYPTGDPQTTFADPTVRKALSLAAQGEPGGDADAGPSVIAITARVQGAGAFTLTREAIVSVTVAGSFPPFHLFAEDGGY